MFKRFLLIITILVFSLQISISKSEVYIVATIDDEILTNDDIKMEAKYLKSLNPNLSQLTDPQILEIAKNSLTKEIIKKKEIIKIFDLTKENPYLNDYLKNLYTKLNFENEKDFENYLISVSNYSIDEVREKLKIELMWNELVYYKYGSQVILNEDKMIQKIENFENKIRRKYQLSEIVFKKKKDENLEDTINKIKISILEIGFNNTANIYSISDSANLGGKIGWVNENNLSELVIDKLNKILEGQFTEAIQIGNNYIILKIEKIKEENIEIDREEELDKMKKFETNKQLNQFSKIFFEKLKMNYSINEK